MFTILFLPLLPLPATDWLLLFTGDFSSLRFLRMPPHAAGGWFVGWLLVFQCLLSILSPLCIAIAIDTCSVASVGWQLLIEHGQHSIPGQHHRQHHRHQKFFSWLFWTIFHFAHHVQSVPYNFLNPNFTTACQSTAAVVWNHSCNSFSFYVMIKNYISKELLSLWL